MFMNKGKHEVFILKCSFVTPYSLFFHVDDCVARNRKLEVSWMTVLPEIGNLKCPVLQYLSVPPLRFLLFIHQYWSISLVASSISACNNVKFLQPSAPSSKHQVMPHHEDNIHTERQDQSATAAPSNMTAERQPQPRGKQSHSGPESVIKRSRIERQGVKRVKSEC
eukprot:1730162-Amphidinium_carterae.1